MLIYSDRGFFFYAYTNLIFAGEFLPCLFKAEYMETRL